VILHLPSLHENRRVTEDEFWCGFAERQPYLLGALLDTLAGAMRELPDVQLDGTPRMADFARFGVAVERTLGWPDGAFLDAYAANRTGAHALVLEDSLVAKALVGWLASFADGRWTGTATDLLKKLGDTVDEKVPRERDWPKTPAGLSGHLKRLAPALRASGIDVRFGRDMWRRSITIESVGKRASCASPASPEPPTPTRRYDA
jgi:hypothetical protein